MSKRAERAVAAMDLEPGGKYDCIVVGGGIAGLQAAIQLGRYKHRTLVVDKGTGRSTLCRSYHNVLGWPEGISGMELRSIGRKQAERLGVEFIEDEVIQLFRSSDGFIAETRSGGQKLSTANVLLATGLLDRYPKLPGMERCFGLTVYVCPDCDGYEVSGKRTIVMGAGNVGASMALTLHYWTNDLIYINHEPGQSRISTELRERLADKGIEHVELPMTEVLASESGEFEGVRLTDGRVIKGERGFIAFGGNEVQSGLAVQLGLERLENRHIVTDPRSKMTNVPGVWAAGDVGVHAEQVTIAMGEGSQAAIWIHKELLHRKNRTLQSCGN